MLGVELEGDPAVGLRGAQPVEPLAREPLLDLQLLLKRRELRGFAARRQVGLAIGQGGAQLGVELADHPFEGGLLRAPHALAAQRQAEQVGLIGDAADALEPGDIVIVPERLDLESGYTMVVRGLRDWTQILANMGIAVATVALLYRQ